MVFYVGLVLTVEFFLNFGLLGCFCLVIIVLVVGIYKDYFLICLGFKCVIWFDLVLLAKELI